MTDKLDSAINNVVGAANDNTNSLNPSLGRQDKADPLDLAVNTAIANQDKKLKDEVFKDSSLANNEASDLTEEQQKQIADYMRQETVKGKINLLAKINKTPDEMASKVQAARSLGLPDNSLIDISPETEKDVNEALTRNDIKYNPRLDTPLTDSILSNGVDGTIARDSLLELQAIEYRLRRNEEKKRAEKEAAQQSRGLWDNFRYGQLQLENLMIAGGFWVNDRFNRAFDYSQHSINQRNQKLVSLTLETEDMPHDLRTAKIGEAYDDKGVGSALVYMLTNPTIASSFLAQSVPSLALGGPVGKAFTAPVKMAAEKYLASQVLKSYLIKTSTLGAIGATSTASMAYSPNVARGYEKTGDAASALDRAQTQTTVDSAFGFAGGMLPLPSMLSKKLGGRLGNILNVTSEATVQTTSGVGGAYYSAKAVGEEATGGELFTNFVMGYLTAPADIATASLTGGKQFRESFFTDAKTVNDIVKSAVDMPLSKRDPEKAKQFIKNIIAQSDENLKDVYIPSEEFARYFQEQGINPAELADKVTGKQGALEEALATGADLQIPLEIYGVDIAASGHEKAFADILRTAPDALNAKELGELDTKLKESTDEIAKQIDDSIKKETAFLDDKTVYNNVLEQLKEAGTDKSAAEKQALIHQAFFNTIGHRLGIEPKAIFDKYNLKISRQFDIGEANSSVKRYMQTNDTTELFKPSKEEAEAYRENFSKAMKSLVSRNIEIEVGDTPPVLQAAGAPNLKLKLSRDTARKATNGVKHDVSIDTVRNLPELLSDPIAIFKSSTQDNSFVVLVDAFDQSNRPIVAAVHLGVTDKRSVEVNRIASIYGRNNAKDYFGREIKNNNLLYVKNEKSLNSVRSDGLQLPVDGSPNKGSLDNILTDKDVVKLYQANKNSGPNGFIELTNQGVNIKLTENQNLSTFLHESGHFFLNVLGDIESNKPDIVEMNNALKSWLKTDDLKSLTTEQHEKFARGFEAYLMEGKAPSLELKGAFDRFKLWLKDIYKVIKNLNVKLNDDVRRVFDRMLATDEAIDVANAPYREVFSNAEQAGMSTKEFEVYRDIATKANSEAKEKLLNQSLKEISRERTKEWKEAKQETQEQVIKDLQNEPIYVLDDFLRQGVDKNGQQILDVQKLDADLVKSVYGDDLAKQLKRFTQKDGLHPDIVSSMFGFDSTDAMIQQLAAKPSNKVMVSIGTKARLADRFGDILLDGTIADKAILAVESEGRAKVLEAELKAINKQRKIADRVARIKVDDTNKAHKEAEVQARQEQREADKADRQAKREAFDHIAPEKILREASRQMISESTVKNIKPNLYLNAERKANKQAFDAVQKGDWETAAKAKEQERLNHFLYLEAVKALETSDKISSYASSFNKSAKRERINKVSKDGLEQIDAILEQYEFKRVSNRQLERRQNLRNYLDELKANGLELDVPEFVIDNARQVNYKELSFEQLQAVHDSLKAIETVSRLKNKLISAQKQRDFNEFKEEALQSINDNVPVDARAKATSSLSETIADKALGNISKHNANSANLATFAYRADGGRADGVFSNYVYKPIRDAELKQREFSIKHANTFNAILKGVSGKHFKQKTAISSLGGHMIAKGEAIMVALNSGNESNKSRLLTGGIKTRESVNALPLNNRAISEILSTLTQQDWAFVQSVWKMFDDMRPESKELYRTLNGREFKEIGVGTIKTDFGEIKGGYFPLEYDHEAAAVPDGSQKKTVFKEGRSSSLPSNGYTKARAEKVTGTVDLEINLLPAKLNEHVLDLTHRKALIDANKVLTDPEISAALKQKLGVDSYNALYKSIFDIANINHDKGIGAWASWLQKNAAVYYLGASLSTMVNQMPGAFQILKYVNPLDYAREIVTTVGNYKDNLKFIMDSSPSMADRWRSMDLSNSVYSKLQGKGKLAVTHENIQQIALAYMPLFERVFSVPAWMAIYKRETANGRTHEQAVMQADSAVVKSQGGFLNVDKNAYQRNKAIAPFYMFASPFAAVYNSFVDSAFAVRQGKSTALKEIMINTAIVSLAGFGYSLATGQKDDKDSYAKFYITSSLSYATSGIPFVRDIVNFTVDAKGRSALSTPIASTMTNFVNQSKKIATGDTEKIRAEQTLASFAAITGTPLKPITVQGAAIKDLMTGDYRPESTLDAIRHLLYRKNKPR